MRINLGLEYERSKKICELANRDLIAEAESATELIKSKTDKVGNIGILSASGVQAEILSVAASMIGADICFYEMKAPTGDIVFAPEGYVGTNVITYGELDAALAGASSARIEKNEIHTGEIKISFDQKEHYTERDAMRIALNYISASALFVSDSQLCLFSPCSREGFLFGVLASLMSRFRSDFASNETFSDMCAQARPTRLLLGSADAYKLLIRSEILLSTPSRRRSGRLSHPSKRNFERRFQSSARLIKRYRRTYARLPLGNRLYGITAIGELPRDCIDGFTELGIFPMSVLSFCGCPLAGYRYAYEPSGVWHLPEGLRSDMCKVREGGIGTITFFGAGLSLGTADGHTYQPLKFRSEYFCDRIFVSDLYGFSLKHNRFYVKGRLIC